MTRYRYAEKVIVVLWLMMVASSALAQGGVDDGTGGLSDMKTWLDTVVPIIAGIIILVVGPAWGAGWIHGAWIPKFLLGIFAAGVGSYVIGFFL